VTQPPESGSRDADGVHIAGYAALYEPPPPPTVIARSAARLAYEAERALEANTADAEELTRRAIEKLVDAFLLDRRGNASAFARAHRLGREAERRFGCPMEADASGSRWASRCGIHALHSRLGMSPGGPTVGHCSICEAPDFGCEHVPGEVYNGVRCVRIVTEWSMTEVSVVQFPNDPRTYRMLTYTPLRQLERLAGRRLRPGERPVCTHCTDCYGLNGPAVEDLDQSLWPAPASTT
jgi:hypothetical protein